MTVNHLDFLKAAAAQIANEIEKAKSYAVPVDPNVAEFMGAFEETAVSSNDLWSDEEDQPNE